jgi:hypothetical protein
MYLNLATLEYSTRRSGGKVTQMSVCANWCRHHHDDLIYITIASDDMKLQS